MKTRSKGPSKAIAASPTSKVESLPPSESNPPILLILPKNCSQDARIVSLPNPATLTLTRYYVCPVNGFYEFTRITTPKATPRSWLLAPECTRSESQTSNNASSATTTTSVPEPLHGHSKGYIKSNSDLLAATRLDPLFLALPFLGCREQRREQDQLFLSMEDHLDTICEASEEFSFLLRSPKLKELMEMRIRAVCDTVDAGDENMYRLSYKKLAHELISKSQHMYEAGFPPSLEARFIRKVLEEAVVNIPSEDNPEPKILDESEQVVSKAVSEAQPAPQEAQSESSNANENADISLPSPAGHSCGSGKLEQSSVSEKVIHLLKLRTALDFLKFSYLPLKMREPFQSALVKQKSIDFKPLDSHLEHLASLRSQAQALRSLSDNITRKRASADDDDAAELRAEKKRKKEEEEKKKKTESRGVKELKKVDVSGMKKLSSFFSKAPAKKGKENA